MSKTRQIQKQIQRSSPNTSDVVEQLVAEVARLKLESAQQKATIIALKGAGAALWQDNVRFQMAVASEAQRRFKAYNEDFCSVLNMRYFKALAFLIMLIGRTKPVRRLLIDVVDALDATEEAIKRRHEAISSAGLPIPPADVDQLGDDLTLVRQAIELTLNGKTPMSLLKQISRALGKGYARLFDDAIETVNASVPGRKPSSEIRHEIGKQIDELSKSTGSRVKAFEDYFTELTAKGDLRSGEEQEMFGELMRMGDDPFDALDRWLRNHRVDGQINLSIESLST